MIQWVPRSKRSPRLYKPINLRSERDFPSVAKAISLHDRVTQEFQPQTHKFPPPPSKGYIVNYSRRLGLLL